MQSTSASDGTYTLIVTFDIGTDPDFAQVLVQNRVASALASLPPAVQQQGVTTQKKSTAILQIVTLTSPDGRYDSLFLSNYATINLQDVLARLPGVGNVTIFGIGQYSMRIWLRAGSAAGARRSPQDVINAIQQQNQRGAGRADRHAARPPPARISSTPSNVPGRLADVGEFENIIVKVDRRRRAASITRVKDVARVELGAQTYGQFFKLDGKPAAGIAIFQLPEANALEVATDVRATVAELAKDFPPGLVYDIPFDTTTFVRASINEVYRTLISAAVLVLIVIMVFLQDWRAMLVPATTVPVTIIGAFAAMAALGFSVNLATLFGDRARDRHRGRRRDRGGRGGGAPHRAGPVAQGRGDPRHGRAVRPDHRHHAGADVGVPAGGLPAGRHRAAVPPVRAGDRRDRADQRDQRRHPEAHAVRAVAAADAAAAGTSSIGPSTASTTPPSAATRASSARTVRHSRLMVVIGIGPDRAGGLGARRAADRLHPARGPGLR